MPQKILFVLKKRGTSYTDGSSYSTVLKSSGLLNSARFVHENLISYGIDSHIEEVVDNNDINRVVTLHRPDVVIIEAVWVVPEKFEVLRKIHPKVKWVVRVHSETPFLAGEGIAVRWILRYLEQPNVVVSFNSQRTNDEFRSIAEIKLEATHSPEEVAEKVVYLPNYYPVGTESAPYRLNDKDTIDVGCFGAIRPLKNQLIQAVAAVEYAKRNNLGLNFHINGTRVEGGGDNNAKNIRALFDALPERYNLVEHGWMPHSEFVEVIKTMDIGLQVSFTETFNIVAADFVNQGVPVVVSKEINWVSKLFHADCTSSEDMVAKMGRALAYKRFPQRLYDLNRIGLRSYSYASTLTWLETFY
jgi:hypothetical protein